MPKIEIAREEFVRHAAALDAIMAPYWAASEERHATGGFLDVARRKEGEAAQRRLDAAARNALMHALRYLRQNRSFLPLVPIRHRILLHMRQIWREDFPLEPHTSPFRLYRLHSSALDGLKSSVDDAIHGRDAAVGLFIVASKIGDGAGA